MQLKLTLCQVVLGNETMPPGTSKTPDFTVSADLQLRDESRLVAQAKSHDARESLRSSTCAVAGQAPGHQWTSGMAQRSSAVDFARGSLLLEGLEISAWAESLMRDYIKGTRSLSAILNELHQRFAEQKASDRGR